MSKVYIGLLELSGEANPHWDAIADDIGLAVRPMEQDGPIRSGNGAAALVVSAAGAEQAAIDWLDNTDMPAGIPLFVVGSDTGHRIAARLIGHGATDYMALPDDGELLRNALASAAQRRIETSRRSGIGSETDADDPFVELIGRSGAIRRVLDQARRILPHRHATALIVGETGTGKELLARAIHRGGQRRVAPFVALNCSALPANLFESELFGYERGAFTDARQAKPGLFEVADGGTLFLDEIGLLPLELQAKLLRVLEDHEVRRVGGTKSRKVDLRILAATNENLTTAVEEKRFREDLFYRVGVINLTLPPLRSRGEDVILIAEALLKQMAGRHDLALPPMGPEIRSALCSHRWKGNVRELKNSLERCLLLSPPGELVPEELGILPATDIEKDNRIPFPAKLSEITSSAVRSMLEICGGNRSEAARRLDISRKRLRRILESSGG